MGGSIYNQLVVVPLADRRLQLWTVNNNLGLVTSQQQSPDPNSNWTPLTDFSMPTPQTEVATFTAAPLSDGRIQLFAVETMAAGQIWSTWQETTNPSTAWTAWSPFPTPEKGAYAVTAAPLDDGRLQVVVADIAGKIWSTRQRSTDPNSGWTSLASVPTPQTGARFVAASPLSDGRFQLFLLDNSGLIWSTHQQTSDTDAPWLSPSPFQTPQTHVFLLAVGSLSNKGLYLFLEDDTGQYWGTYQQTAQHDTSWSPLSPMPQGVGRSVAAASLSDGRLQIFAGDGTQQGQIVSTRQQTSEPTSEWTPFSPLS